MTHTAKSAGWSANGLPERLVLTAAGLVSGMKVNSDLFLGLSAEIVARKYLRAEFLTAKKKM